MRPSRLALCVLAPLLTAVCARAQLDPCPGDFNHDGAVTIDEILVSVNNALYDCPSPGARFVDNGDGTLTDTRSGLVWEKKDDSDGPHDRDRTYTWSRDGGNAPDGSVFTDFLAGLNRAPCFAGHCDWRLPAVAELQALIDHSRFAPAADPAFQKECTDGCAAARCSCTLLDYYWATPGLVDLPNSAWSVDFNYGYVSGFEKTLPLAARAVRAGP